MITRNVRALNFKKMLLGWCITASLILHALVIYFIYTHSIFLKKPDQKTIIFKSSSSPDVVPLNDQEAFLKKMNLALKESFNDILNFSKEPQLPPKVPEIASAALTKEENASLIQKISTQIPSNRDKFSSKMSFDLDDPIFEYQVENHESMALQEDIAISSSSFENTDYEDLNVSSFSLPSSDAKIQTSSVFISTNLKDIPPLVSLSPTKKEEDLLTIEEPVIEKEFFTSASNSNAQERASRPLMEHNLQNVEFYGLQEIANEAQWDHNFGVDVAYMPLPDQNKYLFCLNLHPDFETDAENLSQNFHFFIDRSNSIEKFRFNGFKRAVQRSLGALKEGDRFNIYIFDRKVCRLSEKLLEVNPKNLQKAEEFLEQQDYKSFFSAADLFKTLEKMIPDDFSKDELHSIILISDGKTFLSASKQQKAISKLLQNNEGSIIFYTAAAGQGNNLVSLDLLSYTTSGKLLYSDTHASFPRKLVRLVQDLHDPIIKNVSIEAFSHHNDQQITLYPSTSFRPPLFANKSYMITGVTNQLHDFTLYIQGQNRNQWLNIKKNISFKEAKKAGRSLEKLWATIQSNFCYDRFLKEGKSSYLKEAKEILAPYKGTICLE